MCHGLDCRKHHGARFYAAVVFPQDGGDGRGRDARLRRATFLPALRLVGVRAEWGRDQVHLGALDAPTG